MSKKSSFVKFLVYVKPYIPFLLLDLFFAICSVSMTLYAPILIGDAIDFIIDVNNVDFISLEIKLLQILIVVLLGPLFLWLFNWIANIVTYHIVRDLRTKAFYKLHRLKFRRLDQFSQGDLINRVIQDIDLVSDGLLQGFTQLFTGIVTVITTLIFMMVINYKIGLIVITLTPLSMVVAYIIAKGSSKTFKEQAKIKADISSIVTENLSNQRVIAAFNNEELVQDNFAEINQKLYKVGFKAQVYSALTNPSTRFINSLVYAAVGVTSAISIIKYNSMNVGQLFIFLSYASQYTKPFNEISSVATELSNSFASVNRVFELLELEEIEENDDAIAMNHAQGNIQIEHLYFSYSKDKPLIEDFNLNVCSGEDIAIVGPTGCGKTTLINLLMGFYEQDSGRILIDGVPTSKILKESLRDNLGMVLQDTWIFNGTVKENIKYGKEDATDEEVIEACKKSYADSFIDKLPNAYDTIISNDEGLSQGQRQLICIARLMLKKPPILILDEATSSIDTRTEILVQKAFKELMKSRTSFVIAHRLSTIKEADLILVMDDGNIVEQGNHNELLAKGGVYKQLYYSQFENAD